MKQFFLDYIGLPIFRIHPATKGQEEAIICFNDINYIKRCLHPVSLTYDILNMSFICICIKPTDLNYVIHSREPDCLSLYRRITHVPNCLHYNPLEYL